MICPLRKIALFFSIVPALVWGEEGSVVTDEVAFLDQVVNELMVDESVEDIKDAMDWELELDSLIYGSMDELYNINMGSRLDIGLSTGVGYRENILYQANDDAVNSSFGFIGLDIFGQYQFEQTEDQFEFMILGDDSHFIDQSELSDDVFVSIGLDYLTDRFGIGEVGAGFSGFYTTSSFDVDVDEPAVVNSGRNGNIHLNWNPRLLSQGTEIEVAQGRYLSGFDSSTYNFTTISYSEKFQMGEKLDYLIGFDAKKKRYPHATAFDEGGNSIEGGEKDVTRLSAVFSLIRRLELGEHKLRAKLIVEGYKESSSVSRYYDRGRASLGGQVRWRHGAWSIESKIEYQRTEYDIRTADLAFVPVDPLYGELINEDDWSWLIEVEHEFSNGWTGFLNWNGSDVESNDVGSSYDSNSIMLGLRAPSFFL